MSKRRISADMTTMVAIGVAVLLIAGYWAAVALSQDFYAVKAPAGSTFSSEEDGAKVYLQYLRALGVEVETLRDFNELPADGTIVAAAATPFEKPPTNAEIRRLREWIEAGGRVVLVGPYAEDLTRGTLGGTNANGRAVTRLEPLVPSVYVQDVTRIEVGPDRVLAADPAWVAHFKDTDGQVLISRTFGEGEVVWLSSIYPVSNDGIGVADNARLATLLAAVDGTTVYFDEYHHGFVSGGGVWERLGPNGQAAVLLAIAALVVALVASSRRVASPIPEPPQRTVRTGAYIGSLAELYRKAGARAEALQTHEEALRIALTRRYGSIQASRIPGAAEAVERSKAARAAGDISEDTFVAIARDLARARQEVEGRDG